MKNICSLLAILSFAFFAACGGSSSSSSSGGSEGGNYVSSSSISNSIYTNNIQSGGGVFAATGSAHTFFFPEGYYVILDGGTNQVTDSGGNYTYSKLDNDTIQINANDIASISFRSIYDYSSETTGNFTNTHNQDIQTGSFNKRSNNVFTPNSIEGETIEFTPVANTSAGLLSNQTPISATFATGGRVTATSSEGSESGSYSTTYISNNDNAYLIINITYDDSNLGTERFYMMFSSSANAYVSTIPNNSSFLAVGRFEVQ